MGISRLPLAFGIVDDELSCSREVRPVGTDVMCWVEAEFILRFLPAPGPGSPLPASQEPSGQRPLRLRALPVSRSLSHLGDLNPNVGNQVDAFSHPVGIMIRIYQALKDVQI